MGYMGYNPTMTTWTCEQCQSQQTVDGRWCDTCQAPRYPSFAIMVATHITEHLADGLSEPLEVLKAMQARPAYARTALDLDFVTRQLRLLTKDTTALARQLVQARSARTMLEVLDQGEPKDKIAVLKAWGPEPNIEHDRGGLTVIVGGDARVQINLGPNMTGTDIRPSLPSDEAKVINIPNESIKVR